MPRKPVAVDESRIIATYRSLVSNASVSKAAELCGTTHAIAYRVLREHGALMPRGGRTLPVMERFWKFVDKSESGCWLWTGYRNENGYGIFNTKDTAYAHRFSYNQFVSPIMEDLEIDHLCRNTSCVNPEHLDAVTSRENTMRGKNFAAVNAKKTECVNGHPFDQENTYIRRDTGGRVCRACQRERMRRYS